MSTRIHRLDPASCTPDADQVTDESVGEPGRRTFLKRTCQAVLAFGLATGHMALAGCDSGGANEGATGVRTGDPGLSLSDGVLTVDLAQYPDLVDVGGALWVVDARVLVVHGPERYRAFSSVCPHEGEPIRVFEPASSGYRLRCPSHDWTFDLEGNPTGKSEAGTEPYTVVEQESQLLITL